MSVTGLSPRGSVAARRGSGGYRRRPPRPPRIGRALSSTRKPRTRPVAKTAASGSGAAMSRMVRPGDGRMTSPGSRALWCASRRWPWELGLRAEPPLPDSPMRKAPGVGPNSAINVQRWVDLAAVIE